MCCSGNQHRLERPGRGEGLPAKWVAPHGSCPWQSLDRRTDFLSQAAPDAFGIWNEDAT